MRHHDRFGASPENNALAARSLLERVTGIEPALSVWESVPSAPAMRPDLRGGVSASDREGPLVTGVNGPARVVAEGGCDAGSRSAARW